MQENIKNPLVSIIIVNYNGKKWLEKCISSLLNQTYKDFEIIFVDNASQDNSIEYMKNTFQDDRIKIIENKENSGFAGGNNLGYKHSIGEYILLLNNDTWVESDFLENLLNEIKEKNLDIIGPKEYDYYGNILKYKQYGIDFLGHVVFYNNFLKNKLFYLQGNCILMKKSLYDYVGRLDDDFFMYVEEVDFFWRARLLKKDFNIGISNIPIYHAGAGSTGEGIKYNVFLWRNQNTLQMLLKNYPLYNLLWVLPIYLIINLFEILFFFIIFKPNISYTYIKGWLYNIKILSKTLKKRKEIQQKRIISDKEIMKYMYRGFGKFHHLVSYFRKNVN